MTLRLCLTSCLVASFATTTGAALAQSRATERERPTVDAPSTPALETVEGYVVALDSDDLVLDLARDRGARPGDLVELWRPLSLRHPITGKIVRDRFQIGVLELTQVRDALSFATPHGKTARDPQPGDIVVLRRRPAPAAKVASTTSRSSKKRAAVKPRGKANPYDVDSATFELAQLFDELKGASLVRRIDAYEDYMEEYPKGRYTHVLGEEAAALKQLIRFREKTGRDEMPHLKSFDAPAEVLSDAEIDIAVEIAGPVMGAVFHSRKPGELTYESTPMEAAGARYFIVRLAKERIEVPRLEYFIEAVPPSGEPLSVVGSSARPLKLSIIQKPSPEPPVRRDMTFSIWTDYADYNELRGNDFVWQTEGYFGMRYGEVGLRALRTGFGVYRGQGGSILELDQGLLGRKIGLTYGYLESEVGLSTFVGLVGRAVIGLEDNGLAGGAQGLVRLGNDRKTNLLVGGEILGGVGLKGITQLELAPAGRTPVTLRVEVTNQPAGVSVSSPPPETASGEPGTSVGTSEVGVRAIAQFGYRVVDGLVVAARGSYQGRTIKHSGPGAGAAVSYTW